MSYCIQVHPEAGVLLRSLAPYAVLRLGRALADLADTIGTASEGGVHDLRIDDCVVRFVVDHARRMLEVIHVEQREPLADPMYSLGSSR